MVGSTDYPQQENDKAPSPRCRAAAYVRMSTDHQRYSTENQADAIRNYASARNIDIVKTYADEGKSGLSLDGRDALKQLIDDVAKGRANFDMILVYDVSRWGRFQDADESAYYEYICKRAGIIVHYCAEQFDNDGSPFSTIVKGVKRAMAGEYSRELSTKVFAGQCRLIELGYRQGGPAGFGIRRILIDQSGLRKGELSRGEHKSIQTDRVILVPGPDVEVAVVHQIYNAFVTGGRAERDIAEELNASGHFTDRDKPWTRGTVHQVLINEKYIGNNVWNRTSSKLKKKRVSNAPDAWIRADGVFPAIIERQLFDAAQAIIRARSVRLTDLDMLNALRALFDQQGGLSGLIIDESEGLPSSSAYRSRFGSLLRAYSLIGYTPHRDYRYIEINRSLRQLHPNVVEDILGGLQRAGSAVFKDSNTDLVRVNDEFSLSVVIARCIRTATGSLRWRVRLDAGLRPDITVAVRMDATNNTPLDFYLFPHLDRAGDRLRLSEENGLGLDAYRFDTLDFLFEISTPIHIEEVA